LHAKIIGRAHARDAAFTPTLGSRLASAKRFSARASRRLAAALRTSVLACKARCTSESSSGSWKARQNSLTGSAAAASAGALAKLPANSGWYSLTGGALEQPARASTAASSGK
jgi:hypothetical protein